MTIPRDTIYRLNPPMDGGLDALRRQLRDRGAGAPADVLGPISALSDLRAICEAMLVGRGGPNVENRRSLNKDLSVALRRLGRHTQRVGGAVLAEFQKELAHLQARLDTPQGARLVGLALGSLFEKLSEPELLRAAWRDTVETFTDHAQPAELCELRLLQLAEMTENRGQDWAQRAGTLEYILSDDAPVLARVGALTEHEVADGRDLGGLDEGRRIEVCGDILVRQDPMSPVAVWLVIDNAALEGGYLQVGPVQLFDQGVWPDAVRPGGQLEQQIEGFQAPRELADWEEAEVWFGHLNEAEHRVFARVWLTAAPVPAARERAHRLVQSMIDLAAANSAWVLLKGAVSWRESGGWSGSTFKDPSALAGAHGPVHAVFEPTARGLTEFDASFIERLLANEPVADEAVEDALWTVSVERAPSAPQRLLLATRAVERTLSRARSSRNESWAQPTKRFLKAPWIDYSLYNELFDAGKSATYLIPDRWRANHELYREVQETVFPPTGPGERQFHLRGLADVAPKVLAAMPEGSMEQRIVRDAHAVLTDPAAAVAQLKRLQARFDNLLGRTERQRNALVHGTGTVDAVLDTVDRFVSVLARYVAQEAMRQAETGNEPLLELERARVRLLSQQERLEAGEAPLDVLFPSE